MKRLLFAIAFTACVCGANAQGFNDGKVNLGVRLGMNISKLGGDKGWDNYKSKIGFRLGVAADYEFYHSMFVESGLYVTTKGAKWKEGSEKNTFNLTYLQLPILYSYKYNLGNDLMLNGKIGPYLAVALSAKDKYKDSEYPDDDETTKGFGKDKTGLKAFDAGLQIGIGASKGRYSLGLNYEIGLANISAFTDDKTHTGCFNITLGYNF